MCRIVTATLQPTTEGMKARIWVVSLASAILLGLHVGAAEAAWVAEPSAQIESAVYDNATLDSDDEEQGIISSAGVQARIARQTELSEVAVLGGISITQYEGIESFEDENSREQIFLAMRGNRRFERGNVALNGSYRRQDLLRNLSLINLPDDTGANTGTSGLPEPGLDDDLINEDNVDQGAFKTLVQRNDLRINPTAGYQLTPSTSILLGFSYRDLSFEDTDEVRNLQTSETFNYYVNAQHLLSARDRVWLRGEHSRFEPEQALVADTWSGTVGWSRALSELTRVTLGVGARRTDNDVDQETGYLVNGRVDRRIAAGRLYALVERSLFPNSYGEVVETDRINLGINAAISPRWSWTFSVNAFSTDSSLSNNGRNNQDYVEVTPRLVWALAEEWSVGLNYSYRWVDRERDAATASGNSIGLSLAYIPRRRN